MTVAALVWCPFPDKASAAAVARTLLAERMVACVNLLPEVRSLYLWQGETAESQETGALFKTTASLLPRVIARIAELHPYDTPAVVGWRCDEAGEPTLAWLRDCLAAPV